MKNGFRIFYTCSKALADDVQELLLKVGRVGIVEESSEEKAQKDRNHQADSSGPQYEVLERVKKA